MAGWNLKEGVCLKPNSSDKELWNAIEHLYSNSHKTATYKFCFFKCILDCIPELPGLELDFDNLFYCFTKIYWDLIVKYKLSQIYANSKYQKSKVENIILQALLYQDIEAPNNIEDLPVNIRKDLVRSVTQYCSQNVVGAFYESTFGLFYSFSKKERTITLTQTSKSFLMRHSSYIEEINYINWAKMLEKINGNSISTSLVTKMVKLGNNIQELSPLQQKNVFALDNKSDLGDIVPRKV